LKQLVEIYNRQITESTENLKDIHNHLNLILVPLRSFMQNISTIKIFTASLKHDLSSIPNINTKIINVVESLDKAIYKVKSINPLINENINTMIGEIRTTLATFKEIKKINVGNVENILKQILSSIQIFAQLHGEAALQIPELTAKTENYFENIDKVITNLQYHDIIRQKIEHIQKTHQEILLQLNELNALDNSINSVEMQNKLLTKIHDIAGLQVAQLIHINKQYQTAIETISARFMEISNDMTSISSISTRFSGIDLLQNSSNNFVEIEAKIENVINILIQLFKSFIQFFAKTENVAKHIERLNNTFSNYSNLDAVFVETSDTIVSVNFETSDNPINQSLFQLKSLLTDIYSNIETIKTLIGYCSQKSKSIFDNSKFETNTEYFDRLQIKLTNSVNASIGVLTDNSLIISRILKQNAELGSEISSQTQVALGNIKYYDYFESIVEEIVSKLNELYTKLKDNNKKPNTLELKENLEELEKRYTMESQRNIHNEYTENENITCFVNPKEAENEEDSENFELF